MRHGQGGVRLEYVSRVARTAAKAGATLIALATITLTANAQTTTIYLDYDGHEEFDYGNVGHIDLGGFVGSANDRDEIQQRLEEDFAPFDVVFTTEEPSEIDGGYDLSPPWRRVIRLAIGGNVTELGFRGGIATTPFDTNAVFVAESNSGGRRSNAHIATNAAHELGHAFGHVALQLPHATLSNYLSHYVGAPFTGTSSNPLARIEHNLTADEKTQIMGGLQGDTFRTIWWKDFNVAKGFRLGGDWSNPDDWIWMWQDDVLSLAAVLGLRADDHGDTPSTGSGLRTRNTIMGPILEGSGIVEMNGVSWPGMCPPVPLWFSCPESDNHSPGPEGQSVVLATQKDFFRFDIPIMNWTEAPPRVEIRVNTVSERLVARYGSAVDLNAENLDAELEVWFEDPSQGWMNVTGVGFRQDGLHDSYVRWTADAVNLTTGSYALAVKSAGGYGDLGSYDVSVAGFEGLVVEAGDDPWPGGGGGVLIPPDQIDRLFERLRGMREGFEVVGLLTAVAERGAQWALDAENRFDIAEAKSTAVLVDSALKQSTPRQVVSSFIDWRSVDRDPDELMLRLEEVLRRIDFGETAPRDDSDREAPWIWPLSFEAHDHEECEEAIEVGE